MIYVKVTLSDGNHFTTGINATLEEAKAYYASYQNVTEHADGRETFASVVYVTLA